MPKPDPTKNHPDLAELLKRVERLESALVAVQDRNRALASIEHMEALEALLAPAHRARDARLAEERARARARKVAEKEAKAAEHQAELARIRLEGDQLPEELARLLGKAEVLRALDRLVAPLVGAASRKDRVLIFARARAVTSNGSKRAGPGSILTEHVRSALNALPAADRNAAFEQQVATVHTSAGLAGEWSVEWALAVLTTDFAARLADEALSNGHNDAEMRALAAKLTSPDVPSGHLRVLFASTETLDFVSRPVVEVVHVRRPSTEAKAA
jgi:hypothetical protein